MTLVIVYAVHLARKRIAMLAEGTAEKATAAGFGTHGIDTAIKGDGPRKVGRLEFPEPGQVYHVGDSLVDIAAQVRENLFAVAQREHVREREAPAEPLLAPENGGSPKHDENTRSTLAKFRAGERDHPFAPAEHAKRDHVVPADERPGDNLVRSETPVDIEVAVRLLKTVQVAGEHVERVACIGRLVNTSSVSPALAGLFRNAETRQLAP